MDYLDLVLLDPAGYRAIQGVVHAREMLDAGFTTVRDVGNAGNYVDVDLQRAINEGLVPGPTMLVAGRIIAPFGGQYRTRAEKRFLDNPEYFFADTADEIRKAVRENVYYGANVIKVVADGQKYSYTAEDLKLFVSESARAGVRVAVHCQTKTCERDAAAAGVASIEHGWSLADADTRELIEERSRARQHGRHGEGARGLRLERGGREAHSRRARRATEARLRGGRHHSLRLGRDGLGGGRDARHARRRLRGQLLEAGFPAKEILKIMTVNAARLLGVERERGTIAPGMYADIIATRGDPLEDARALKRVTFVMKDGRVHKQDR